ncbi:MAG: DUF1538 domain-containing protein [Verrucomicrobiota bacterium]
MTDATPKKPSALSQLGVAGVASIIWRYFKEKAIEQFKSVWFIVTYLLLFQIVILKVPITYGATISAGLIFVIIGLTFFMEGLRLGLMPFGETIGAILPRNSKLPTIMLFAFILGVGATLAEPAISVLKQAGSGVQPDQAPLLYSILNDFSTQLVVCVGIGVGLAVTLGILRFFFGWPLKVLILPIVLLLASMTIFAHFNPILRPVIGLAWDCGAVTTGPVTVPLVLALGIGVCRIIGDKDSGAAGFGIVTLASLFPIIAVLLLSFYHFSAKDYFGAENYRGDTAALLTEAQEVDSGETMSEWEQEPELPFTEEEFETYKENGKFPENVEGYKTTYRGGEVVMENGRIVHRDMEVVLEKEDVMGTIETFFVEQTRRPWNPDADLGKELISAFLMAAQAILPLCGFLFLTLLVVLRERLRRGDEIAIGIVFAVFGMALFGLGLTLGLTPLGTQLGSNVPVTFASITPWGLSGTLPPLFENPFLGKLVAILFAFFLGYGATLAEPALNALGQTVEDSTVGVFKKKLLMQVVAIGVGMGIAAGVSQMAFASLELTWLLIPPYLFLLFLTIISSDEFVNFAWDSAGVTTGPITVPLVLSMGLGIGANIPGVIDGFGILALASVGPIITVLTVGLIVNRAAERNLPSESKEDADEL